MKKWLARWALHVWYGKSFVSFLLLPFSLIFISLVKLRKFLYQSGFKTIHQLAVPVVVVGNMTVGGTGKTPLIIWLAALLIDSGYRPGIISRGYGGKSESWPRWIDVNSDVNEVGDEAVLLARKTACPMVASPSRVDAARLLLNKTDCDIILSDDGLQHYALGRDIECIVVDGERRFGNGFCIPAGPLREPSSRLENADFIVVNGRKLADNEFAMQLLGDKAINLLNGETKDLAEFKQTRCHAIAAIGNPDRFFKLLETAGLSYQTHRFPDHYAFQHQDIQFNDDKPVLMTEKDAVKCLSFAGSNNWYIPVQAVLEADFANQILHLLREKYDRSKIA